MHGRLSPKSFIIKTIASKLCLLKTKYNFIPSIIKLSHFMLSFFQVDSCNYIACAKEEVCLPRAHSRPECKCPACQPAYSLVCGSDDRTYASLCQLKKFSCQEKENITVKKMKACGNEFNTFFFRSSGKYSINTKI